MPYKQAAHTLLIALSLAASACAGNRMARTAPTGDIPALEARAARRPGDVETAVLLGAAYRDAGRAGDAARVLADAHARAPRDERTVLLLGLAWEDQGELARARELYETFERAGVSRRVRGQLRDRLALLERRGRQAEVRAAVAREAELAATPPREGTVAVFPFLFSGGDESLRPLERALAEFLVTDLSQTGRLDVVERARVQLLLDEIAMGETGRMDPATAARGGRLLGAEHVVQGRLGGTEAALEMEVRVARTGAAGAGTGQAVGRRGGLRQLIEMQKELALGIYQRLGVNLTPAERELVLRRPTENLQAVLAYGRGLEAADAGDFARAADHFTQAATLDPGFAAARAQAGEAQGAGRAAGLSTAQVLANARTEPDAALDAVRTLVPGQEPRDPLAEAIGREGFGGSGTWIELILRRP